MEVPAVARLSAPFQACGWGAGQPARFEAASLGIADLDDDTAPDLFVTDFGRLWMFESCAERAWYESAPRLGASPRSRPPDPPTRARRV